MNELMIIVFGLAVIRSLNQIYNEEKLSGYRQFVKVVSAVLMCWAFYHLLVNCATITF